MQQLAELWQESPGTMRVKDGAVTGLVEGGLLALDSDTGIMQGVANWEQHQELVAGTPRGSSV